MAASIFLRIRSRGSAASRRLQARLLSLGVSLLLSLMVLDAGAAGRHAWLHRTPRLPEIRHENDRTAPTVLGRRPTGAASLQPSTPNARAAAGPLRILVIGESSGRGEPYHPWLSVGQIVAWKLESIFPGRPIQVDTWATGGATLRDMHDKLADLTYHPDAMVVYVGHNEFQARFPWMRDEGYYRDE